VHLGHRALVAAARQTADRLGAPLAVMTFEPHPREFFQPGGEPFRLTLLPMKQRLLETLGVDHLFALRFDAAFSRVTAREFIEEILKNGLGARHLVTGPDFSFGRGREGTVQMLQEAQKHGLFGFTQVAPALCNGQMIYSSTRIRAHIRAGELEKAASLLGHPFELEGEVVHGDKRGRTIGYPTANQQIPRYIRPPYGIYAVKVKVLGEKTWRDGVSSLGIRPMFEVKQPILETFIFDFNDDIYGKTMRVRLVQKLRPEMNFSDLDALKTRIHEDCLAARAVLKSTSL
jgi:riboflavin kinase/FMN adenylyltransferase